jgi:hypothetical protein
LLEQRATVHQPLLAFVSRELYVKIVGVSPDDFVQPVKDRLQRGKLSGRLDLLAEPLEFLKRTDVFYAHADYRTPAGASLCNRTALASILANPTLRNPNRKQGVFTGSALRSFPFEGEGEACRNPSTSAARLGRLAGCLWTGPWYLARTAHPISNQPGGPDEAFWEICPGRSA